MLRPAPLHSTRWSAWAAGRSAWIGCGGASPPCQGARGAVAASGSMASAATAATAAATGRRAWTRPSRRVASWCAPAAGRRPPPRPFRMLAAGGGRFSRSRDCGQAGPIRQFGRHGRHTSRRRIRRARRRGGGWPPAGLEGGRPPAGRPAGPPAARRRRSAPCS